VHFYRTIKYEDSTALCYRSRDKFKSAVNQNVFSLVLNVLKQSYDCTDSGRLFQTTGAHTLKARIANAVLVYGTARRVRDVDLNEILVPEMRAEIRSPGSPVSM